MTEFIVTADMLAPVGDAVKSAITVGLPAGLGIFALGLGINWVKKMIRKFS